MVVAKHMLLRRVLGVLVSYLAQPSMMEILSFIPYKETSQTVQFAKYT